MIDEPGLPLTFNDKCHFNDGRIHYRSASAYISGDVNSAVLNVTALMKSLVLR